MSCCARCMSVTVVTPSCQMHCACSWWRLGTREDGVLGFGGVSQVQHSTYLNDGALALCGQILLSQPALACRRSPHTAQLCMLQSLLGALLAQDTSCAPAAPSRSCSMCCCTEQATVVQTVDAQLLHHMTHAQHHQHPSLRSCAEQ